MGVLDALTILGSGIGRGYRGSQELQRQLAEQKRKALLEEREQIVRETTAKSQQALTEAQIQTEALNRAIGQFGLDVNKQKFKTSQAPVAGGAPLKLSFLGNNVELPGNLQSMTDVGDLIRQLSEEKFKHTHPEYFTNYPPAGTAAAEKKYSPAEKRKEYLLRSAQAASAGGPAISEDNDAYIDRVSRTIELLMARFKKEDPSAFSDVDTTKAGKNRFNVDVK